MATASKSSRVESTRPRERDANDDDGDRRRDQKEWWSPSSWAPFADCIQLGPNEKETDARLRRCRCRLEPPQTTKLAWMTCRLIESTFKKKNSRFYLSLFSIECDSDGDSSRRLVNDRLIELCAFLSKLLIDSQVIHVSFKKRRKKKSPRRKEISNLWPTCSTRPDKRNRLKRIDRKITPTKRIAQSSPHDLDWSVAMIVIIFSVDMCRGVFFFILWLYFFVLPLSGYPRSIPSCRYPCSF